MSAPVDVCEARDAVLFPDGDGLYARARRGEVKAFTGVTAPYEVPTDPALAISADATVDGAVDAILALLRERGVIAG